MTSILLVLLTAALGASLVAGWMRINYWKGVCGEIREIYEDTQEQMVEARVELERVVGENKWLKAIFDRPLVATLSDAQAANLTQAVISFISSLKDPNLLN